MMKKLISVLMAFCFVILTACASNNSEVSNTEESAIRSVNEGTVNIVPTDPAETTAPVQTTAPAALSEDEIYTTFLQELCGDLRDIIVDDTHLDSFFYREGMIGVYEIAARGGIDMLKKIGYTVQDINNDGVSELILCQVDDPNQESCNGIRILCAYTIAENEAVLLFEGNSQNRYYILDDATIYNETSDSAVCLGFGIYQLDAENPAISCEEFFFMDMTDAQNGKFYRNMTGQFDTSASETLEIDKVAYDTMQMEYVYRIQSLELILLDAFEG